MERLLFCEYLQKADVCREHKKLFAALVEWCWYRPHIIVGKL